MVKSGLYRNGKTKSAKFIILIALAGALAVAGLHKTAQAAGEPALTGGADVVGVTDSNVAITDVQISGSGNPTVPVDLFVPSGTLSMTTTTGLTFTGSPTGSHLQFSGLLDDVNTALATLHYRTDRPKNIQLSMALTAADEVYNPLNGHVYQTLMVGDGEDTGITAVDARTAAAASTRYGLTGYLLTITSQAENDFIHDRISSNSWIGASDLETEGVWKWDVGPENNTQFWQGLGANNGGTVVSSRYNNWAAGEPNDSGGNEDCGEYYSGAGNWNDLPCTDFNLGSYVIEYGADGQLPAVAHKTVNIAISYPTGGVTTVNNCTQLADIAVDPVGYRYDTINIAADMDCGGVTIQPLFQYYDEELGWVDFRGTFNGQGHTISNYVISSTANFTGLIAKAFDATIENLTINYATVGGDSCTGGLVGTAEDVTISDVDMQNTSVAGTGSNTGGLVGCLNAYTGTHSLTNSSFSGNVANDNYYAGGLIGYAESDTEANYSITNNTLSAGVHAQWSQVGSLVGEFDAGNESVVTISGNLANGSVNSQGSTGGAVGYLSIDQGTTLTMNNNEVNQGISGSGNTGGLIGYFDAQGESTATFSDNSVGTEMDGNYGTGGLIGEYYGDGAGDVAITGNSINAYANGYGAVGGLIGELDNYGYNSKSVTIDNNSTRGAMDGNYNVAGLIGYMYQNGNDEGGSPGTISLTNNNSSQDLTTDDGTSGGLIGEIETYYASTITLQKSYFTGTVDADGVAGGLIGEIYDESYNGDTAIHVLDSYVNADISGGYDTAGAIGYIDAYSDDGDSRATVDIQRVYTYGSVTGQEYIAGLVGYIESIDNQPATVTIKNSFSAASINTSGSPEYLAGLLGYFAQGDEHLTTSGNYYDGSRTGAANCTGWNGGIDFDCITINASNDQEDYFLTHTNQPLAHWDFANVWGYNQELNDGFPCLQTQESCVASVDGDSDGVDNTIEAAGPNDGDANSDGIADSSQTNVTSEVNVVTGGYAVLETSCESNLNVQLGGESADHADSAFNYPVGLYGFIASGCGAPGVTVTVTQYFYGNYNASDFVARKWHGNVYTTIDNAVLANVTIGGQPALKVTYQVVDGGPLDDDGQANGSITDPSGPGKAVIGAPNTGLQLER